MSGIIFYKLSPNNYHPYMIGYDYTKNSSLVGSEIDSNFHYLEGMDIHSMVMNGHNLEFTRIKGTTESVKLTPYTPTCGISINADNEISLSFKQLGGVMCFDNEITVATGCGLSIGTEEETCDNFNSFIIKMLGSYTGNRYILSEIPINGQFYGGRTIASTCDTPDCTLDQFYDDYMQYLRNGFLKLDVCGIECVNGISKINVDENTIKLEDCQLKVNYGCGLTVHDTETEQDYINFLSSNWDDLTGQTPGELGYVSLECYLDRTQAVNEQYYGGSEGIYTDDQYHELYVFKPTLSTDLNKSGGLICTSNGLSIDYGCGLKIDNDVDVLGLIDYIKNTLNLQQSHKKNSQELYSPDDLEDDIDWKNDVHYESYVECLHSGALEVSLFNGSGIMCTNGSLRLNLGCGLSIEEITASCEAEGTIGEDDSYQSFLYKHWEELTGYQNHDNFYEYWNGNYTINCENFGHSACSGQTCSPCDSWFNDQFFCSYLSYVNAGRLVVNVDNNTIFCNTNGKITTTQQA